MRTLEFRIFFFSHFAAKMNCWRLAHTLCCLISRIYYNLKTFGFFSSSCSWLMQTTTYAVLLVEFILFVFLWRFSPLSGLWALSHEHVHDAFTRACVSFDQYLKRTFDFFLFALLLLPLQFNLFMPVSHSMLGLSTDVWSFVWMPNVHIRTNMSRHSMHNRLECANFSQ